METVTLKTVPTRMVLAFLVSLGFVALGFVLLRDASIPVALRFMFGWVSTSFFGLATLVSLLSLRPGAYHLRLRKDLKSRHLCDFTFIAWEMSKSSQFIQVPEQRSGTPF